MAEFPTSEVSAEWERERESTHISVFQLGELGELSRRCLAGVVCIRTRAGGIAASDPTHTRGTRVRNTRLEPADCILHSLVCSKAAGGGSNYFARDGRAGSSRIGQTRLLLATWCCVYTYKWCYIPHTRRQFIIVCARGTRGQTHLWALSLYVLADGIYTAL